MVRVLVVLAAIGALAGACATRRPEQAAREAIRWDAARECEKRYSTIRVNEIDHLGRLSITFMNTAADTEPFFACYRQEVQRREAVPPK